MGHPTAIFLSPPDPNFRCGICLDVFDDPVSLLHCGHTFCRVCLDSSLCQTGRRCPECRAEIDLDDDDDDDDDDDYLDENRLLNSGGNGNVIHPVRVVRSAIDNSLVRCGNGRLDEDGGPLPDGDGRRTCVCDWTGPLSSWRLHSSTTCPVAKSRCPIPGCQHECPRALLRAHVGSAECVKAAVVSQVEERMNGFLSDLRRQMRKEVQRRVRELREEKEALEARLGLESDRRLELQRENCNLQRENWGLRREAREMKRAAMGLVEEDRHRRPREKSREAGEGEGERRPSSRKPPEAAEDAAVSARGKSNGRKRGRRGSAHGDVSVSPARSSDDGDATASPATAADDGGSGEGGDAKRRRKKKKRRSTRRQRQGQGQPPDEAGVQRWRMRAISSEDFD